MINTYCDFTYHILFSGEVLTLHSAECTLILTGFFTFCRRCHDSALYGGMLYVEELYDISIVHLEFLGN
jgi:hypothetical protein